MSSAEPFLPLQGSDAEAPQAAHEPTGGPFHPDAADSDEVDVFLPDSDADAGADPAAGANAGDTAPPPADGPFRTPTGQTADPADD